MTQIFPNSLVSGNGAIQTYKRNGLDLTTQGIEELIIIQTSSIAQNTAKLIPLSKEKINLKLLSIYVSPTNKNLTDYTATLKLLENGVEFTTFSLTKSDIPFSFPEAIITPEMDLEITPSVAMDKIVFYAKQIAIIEKLNY